MPFNPFIEQQRNQRIFMDGKGTGHWQPEIWEPPCELLETTNGYVLKAELPGIDKKTLNVKYANNWLVISGYKPVDENIQYTELLYGNFKKEIPLPTDVDGTKIQAKYQEGILIILIPLTPVIILYPLYAK